MDGHSLEEVAELLQLPLGTVKSRLHSARKRLAEKLR
jgi:RNA polymerase sigma-70 factor (ECF subfamily)